MLDGNGSGWINLQNLSSRDTLKMAQYQTNGEPKYLVSFAFTGQYDPSACQSKIKCRAAYY